MNDIFDIQIKKQNTDFHVNEIPFDKIYGAGTHAIYNLRKEGLTTNQAVECIANSIGCDVTDISYSGLKDEDGVTTQQISTPFQINKENLNNINKSSDSINLSYQGNTDESLKIGVLHGNSFKVTARNISLDFASKLSSISSMKSVFINYYGIQRFGIPNMKKTTHLIGQHLLKHDYSSALSLIIEQQPENPKLSTYLKNPKKYFQEIDQRQYAFFLSSYYSYHWNNRLISIIKDSCETVWEQQLENIPYVYIKDKQDKLNVMSKCFELDLEKFRVFSKQITKLTSKRTTFIHSEIFVNNIKDDNFNPGKKCVDLSFAIPSGSYATVIIPQFFYESL